MLEIPKQYVLDEQHRTLAVQIPIAVYKQIENDEGLSGDIAQSYYDSLKKHNLES